MAAAGLLIYVARHRDEWRGGAAAQTRVFVEEGLQRHFPRDVSPHLIREFALRVEQGSLAARPSKESLERLRDANVQLETNREITAEDWAEYLGTLVEALFEGRFDPARMEELQVWKSGHDFKAMDKETAEEFLRRLMRVLGASERDGVTPEQ